MDKKQYGANLRAMRILAGLTPRQLGERCGYSGDSGRAMVCQWESGDRPIPLDKMRLAAKALGVNVIELIP